MQGARDWLARCLPRLRWNSAADLVRGLLPLGLAVGLTMMATMYREELQAVAGYGYAGIFFACVAANSSVFLPAPSSAIVMAFGHVYAPFWVAVAGGLGAATGELVGYLAGFSGHRLIDTSERGQQLQAWMASHGPLTIFIFAFLPLPLFDLVGVMAGVLRVSLVRFLVPTVAGKVLKMLIYAYVGAGLLPLLEPYVRRALGQ